VTRPGRASLAGNRLIPRAPSAIADPLKREASETSGAFVLSGRSVCLPKVKRVSGKAAIEVENLVREFRKGPRAVDGIDLAVSPGEIYGFLGPNGAGKSTTVLMLTTLLPPTSGRATVGGFDIVRQGAQVRATIGAALQEAALDAILTGREHLMLQATLQGLPGAERRRRTAELLERVGLTEAADRRVGGYSGGMKRRLDLALALVHSPRILFLDEPTTGLDPQSRSALWEEVARLARDDGMTVFLTTQYLEEADVLAGRIGIIDHGRIVAEGTPAQLKADIGGPSVEVTPAEPDDGGRLAELLTQFGEMRRDGNGSVTVHLPGGEAELAEIVRILDRASLRVETLQLHQPSLDDVFLAQTGRKLEGSGGGAEAEDGAAEAAPKGRRGRRRRGR
jgi:ABC-2 type transport system ATP-binding protein